MPSFNSIEELYEELEKTAFEYRYVHQLGGLFEPLIDKYREEGDSERENWAIIEREIFFFEISDGQLNPRIVYTDEHGNSIPYPDITKFDEKSLEYIKQRLSFSKNLLLRARYGIALWESKKKHGKYAIIASDSYLELVDIYKERDKTRPDDHFGLRALESLKNAYYLAKFINDGQRRNKIKKKIVDELITYNWKSKSSYAIRRDLLNLMLEERFEKDYFDLLQNTFKKLIESSKGQQKIWILNTIININNRFNKDINNELKKIAEEYEKLMNGALKTNPLAAIHFWENARLNYEKINDIKKIEELDTKYDEIKNKAKYEEFGVSIDVSEIDKNFEDIAKKISELDAIDIIKVLIMDKNLLPDIDVVKKEAIDLLEEHPIQRILPISVIDDRGNIAGKYITDEEIKKYKILSNYRLHVEMLNKLLLNRIFYKIIENNSLKSEDLIKYLEMHSWLGKKIQSSSSDNTTVTYCWLDSIRQGLKHYFDETKRWIETNKEPDYTLCIDSLTLKIEGMYRDMHRLSGIPTFRTININNIKITEVKTLGILLRENKLNLFEESEIMLFKYVLVERIGYNLRNKVAHSLMINKDYTFTNINLIIFIILKIAKFIFF
ncbi:MAG: DUF7380 domain-containing protein [Promethearchaeota archaeon]